MKKHLLTLLFITFYLSLSAQSITGRVYDRLTGDYLEGALVTLEGKSIQNTQTDDRGNFNFSKLLPGKYRLKVNHIGFHSFQRDLELDIRSIDLDISLEASLNTLPEIKVVSASRRSTSPVALPYASSVLTRPAQSDNMPRSTPEALSLVPGVFVQKTNHGGGSPFIRGLTGNQTLILIDGIRLNNSTFRYGPNQYFNTIDPFSIQKIEVLRGSGSVQYGSDAMGGVIQVFTKEPGFSNERKFDGTLNARYGSGNMEKSGSTELVYSSPKMIFSGILGIKDFGDLIGGDTTGRQSPSGYTESDASLKFKWKLSEDTELTLANQFVEQRSVDVFHKVKLENYKINEMGVQARNLSYLKVRIEKSNPLFNQINLIASLNNTLEDRNSQKNASLISSHERDKVNTANLSFEIFSDLSERWTANSGTEYYHDRIKSMRNTVDGQNGSLKMLRGLYPDNSSYVNTSVYSIHHLKFGRFNVEAGVRYNWLKASFVDMDLGQVRVSPNAFVWNTGANYSFNSHHIYASLNTGYRAPNIDDMGTLGIVDFRYELPSYALKPEKSYNSEIGYKYDSRNWNFGLSVYHNKLNNLINRIQTGQIIDGYNVYRKENTEEAVIKGVEGSFGWQANRRLLFDLFASFNHGQNLSRSEPLRRMPPFNGYASMKYVLNKFYIKGELAWADNQSRLAQGDKDDNRIPFAGTPGWNALNFYSGYSLRSVQLRLSAQNLFNADYRTHGSGINSVGRSLWLSLQYDL